MNLNALTDLLLDLWHDLREKRLAPVAIVLMVALVAVPVLLRKPPSAVEPPTPAPAAKQTETPLVAAVDAASAGSTDLGEFDPKDPFKPAVKPRAPAEAGTATPLAPAGPSPAGPDKGAPASGGGATTPSPPTGGSEGPSSPPQLAPPVVPKQRTTFYTYVIDVQFGKRGRERERKGLKRLETLPNDRAPVVVFLGVSGDREKAVFLVDSRLGQSGEGVCRPSVDACTFLYLRDSKERNEHFLIDENGEEYTLTLVDIRRVKVESQASSKRSRSAARRERARRKRARRKRAQGEVRPFNAPLFADESADSLE